MAKKKDSETPKRPRKKPNRPEVIRSYSDADKAHALLALETNNGNVPATALQLGIPAPTLYEWAHGKYINEDVLKLQVDKRPLLAERLKDLAGHICDFLPSKMLTATCVQAATAMGIAIDKALALQGKTPLPNISLMTDDQCLNLLSSIVERAKSRRSSTDATTGENTTLSTPESSDQQPTNDNPRGE